MALARLVVIEGPDLGCEFDIPLRGGGIGRGEGNVVQLSDMSVSRSHCSLELRDGSLHVIDGGSRNKTVVNGQPVDHHALRAGDEIVVGKTRLAYLPAEPASDARAPAPSRVTLEVGSRELLIAGRTPPGMRPPDRARRQLAAIASLGDQLRALGDRDGACKAAAEAMLGALAASRAFVMLRDTGSRMGIAAARIAPDDTEGEHLALPREITDKVVAEAKAICMDTPSGRQAVAAPVFALADEPPLGLVYADRVVGASWDDVDVTAAAGIAYLLSASLVGIQARDVLAAENRDLADRLGGREFVGGSARARTVLEFVAKVGPSDATVLLTGESGSGKEMVARAIHQASRRSKNAFVAVNCAAMTETLIESELFGHEKGAFTGATDRKLGRFETAHKGTLFLDEVGELPLQCQTKFLRVLEEQVFERVGGTRSIAVDVRVVAATNRDLAEMVRRGSFREDLFYRLSVIHTVVPPLRERPEDIPELAQHFLARLRHQVARRIEGFAPEALRALTQHQWPGNVRELKNAIERAIVLGDGPLIRVQDLPPELIGAVAGGRAPTAPFADAPQPQPIKTAGPQPTPPAGTPPPTPRVARSLRELEREGIIAALEATGGNKAQAAAILEIDRSTLYKKLKDYQIG